MTSAWPALASTSNHRFPARFFTGRTREIAFDCSFMKSNRSVARLLTASFISLAGLSPVQAQLPSLNEKKWLGYFVGVETKKAEFGIASDGKSAIKPFNKKGTLVGAKNFIDINFVIEETKPDGKIVAKPLVPESLASENLASNKPKDMKFTGKVAGDATFEVHVSEERGAMVLGGRVTDKGTLTNPLRLAIRVKFPNAYLTEKFDEANKQKMKAFENKTENDLLQLIFSDGKRLKIPSSKPPEEALKTANEKGISAAQFECEGYPNLKFSLAAQPNSALKIIYDETKPLNDGFTLSWSADPEKDPEGKSRFNIELK